MLWKWSWQKVVKNQNHDILTLHFYVTGTHIFKVLLPLFNLQNMTAWLCVSSWEMTRRHMEIICALVRNRWQLLFFYYFIFINKNECKPRAPLKCKQSLLCEKIAHGDKWLAIVPDKLGKWRHALGWEVDVLPRNSKTQKSTDIQENLSIGLSMLCLSLWAHISTAAFPHLLETAGMMVLESFWREGSRGPWPRESGAGGGSWEQEFSQVQEVEWTGLRVGVIQL